MTIEELVHANALETRRLCQKLDELVDVVSGAGVTVPRVLMLSSAEPFKTFKGQSAEQEFHAIRVDNFSTVEVDIKFDGSQPTQQNADERIPPMTGRIIVRPYNVAAVGFDPAVAPAAATPVRVTYYTRALAPATYDLDAGSEISGVYNATAPSLVDGTRNDLQLDQHGSLRTTLVDSLNAQTGAQVSAIVDLGGNPSGAVQMIANARVFNGFTWDRARTPTVFKAVINLPIVAGAPVAVWTPASGKKFRLMGWSLSPSGAATLFFNDGASLNIIRAGSTPAGQTLISPPLGNGYLSALANNALTIDVTSSTNVQGFVFGTEE